MSLTKVQLYCLKPQFFRNDFQQIVITVDNSTEDLIFFNLLSSDNTVTHCHTIIIYYHTYIKIVATVIGSITVSDVSVSNIAQRSKFWI